MLTNKTPLLALAAVACLAFVRADSEDDSFGSKIPPPAAREARDVSSLSLSSEYGAPGTPPPFRQQNNYAQPAFRPPPPPNSYGTPQQSSYSPQQQSTYRPPPPQNSYRPPTQQSHSRPSSSYGTPSNTFGGQFGGGNKHQGGGHHEDHSQWVPQPYDFSYAVKDAYTGNDYSHSESGDGSGSVRGEYRVLLPDGRTQIVTYTATDQTGFNAQVTYQGEARPSGPGVGGGGYGGAGGAQGAVGGGGYYSGGATGGFSGAQGGYNHQGQQHHHQGQQHHNQGQHHSNQGSFHQGPYRK